MNSTELKEAIAEYIKSKELVLMGYSPEYIDDVKTDMEIAFRAGAEWMAEQEQPEVDLDAEIAIYLNRNVLNRINNTDIIEDFTTIEAGELARHFYELGLNARKEE